MTAPTFCLWPSLSSSELDARRDRSLARSRGGCNPNMSGLLSAAQRSSSSHPTTLTASQLVCMRTRRPDGELAPYDTLSNSSRKYQVLRSQPASIDPLRAPKRSINRSIDRQRLSLSPTSKSARAISHALEMRSQRFQTLNETSFAAAATLVASRAQTPANDATTETGLDPDRAQRDWRALVRENKSIVP